MSFAEKLLRCIDCKKDFTFSVEEQQFHSSRGYPNSPGRCPTCRKAKKTASTKVENPSEDFGQRRQTFAVNCTKCGKATRLPFQPRQNEPVYCSDCYIKNKANR